MVDASQQRQILAHRINRLEYMEYARVGWFKAVTLGELHQSADKEAEVADRYMRSPVDAALDRDVIRVFLREWLVWHHPESIAAYGLDVSAFRLISRDEALAVVDRIIEASLEDPEARIGGCLEWLQPTCPEEAADVSYPQLRAWFAELFGLSCRFYLHDSEGGPTVRFNLSNPRVIGLAPDVVGMLWLE